MDINKAEKKAKFVGYIDNNRIMMIKSRIPNTKCQSYVLMPEYTLKNIRKSTEYATEISFEHFQNFVEEHKEYLFKEGQEYTLNTLTEGGWREGDPFVGSDYSFYDPIYWYGPDDYVAHAFAVQIILM